MSTIKQFLSFRLGAEAYGIDILTVQEIRGFEAPTRMVNAPADTLGVLNLRGTIVPVIDLRRRFGMPEPAFDSNTVTIVLNLPGKVVGIVVDSVSDVVNLGAESIKPAPQFSGMVGQSDVIGLGTIETAESARMLILLDIERVIGGAHQEAPVEEAAI
jgi:purine-binding chemotaxis protein CheW